jgi:NAD(P)-dependent dehydrogenase (short-subunit alcohol dehydrogenase family)
MPFGAESTTAEVLAGVDLHGTVALVTGASTGLGWETARALGAAGATVVATVRTPEKAVATARELRNAEPGATFDCGVVALDSLASVRAFAEWVRNRYSALQLLVNNAGVMATPHGQTADGFELQLGTNHLAHFALTTALLPLLEAGAPARVVNLSSGGHVASDILWDDPNFEQTPYDPWVAYGQSKTANILFSLELERRHGPSGVRAYAVHPGRVGTDLGRYLTKESVKALMQRAASGGGMPVTKSVPQGAATTVWAATAPELADRGGLYLADCGVAEAAPWARDPQAATRLWELSEALLAPA